MIPLSVVAEMLDVQDKLNTFTIGPNWIHESPDFCLAIQQECAEGIDHLSWKWWAKQAPDVERAQMEVVDILHFALSQQITLSGKDNAVAEIGFAYNTMYTEELHVFNRSYSLISLNAVQLFRITAGLAAFSVVDFRTVLALAEALSLPFVELSRLYFCKATLNHFRQTHGYKDGTYIKLWGPGREDNDFAQEESRKLNWADPKTRNSLYAFLEAMYKNVTKA